MSKPERLIAATKSATTLKADTKLFPYFSRLIRGENLNFEESADFFRALTDKNTNQIQIAGALTALTTKGETGAELAGMMLAMYEQSNKITTRHSNFINISGTGSSFAKTFNVSTAAAFIVAGAGLAVAKHTDRALMSKTGGADVLEKLGVKVSVEPKIVQACLDGAGIGFLFSPNFHPLSNRIKEISRHLGIKNCLNLLEVLANPANSTKHIIGVWHKSLMEPIAKAVSLLKPECVWIVHGEDGLDEITLAGKTFVTEISGKKTKSFKISPEEFGFERSEISHFKAKTAQESAKLIKEILETKRRDEARILVILNAAAALIVGGIAKDFKTAVLLAEQSLDSRSALIKLERLVDVTNKKSNFYEKLF